MDLIEWADFQKVELRVGTIVAVEPFPEARKPAHKLTIDFGEQVGVRRSSARSPTSTAPQTLSANRSWPW